MPLDEKYFAGPNEYIRLADCPLITELSTEISQRKQSISGLRDDIAASEITLLQITTCRDQLAGNIQILNQHLGQQDIALGAHIDQENSAINQLHEQINSAKEYIIRLEKEADELRTKLEDVQLEIKAINDAIKYLKETEELGTAKDLPTGIETLVNQFKLDANTQLFVKEMMGLCLLKACELGDSEFGTANEALLKGVGANIVDASTNDTALHKAARSNAVELVKLLLAKGCGADIKNIQQQTPIELTTNVEIKTLLFAAQQKKWLQDKSAENNNNYNDHHNVCETTDEPSLPSDIDLEAYLPLNGNSNDISKHGHHGTCHDTTNYKDGPIEALEFDGNAFIKGDADNFPIARRSISLWFKLAPWQDCPNQYKGGVLFSQCGADDNNNFAITINHAVGCGLEKNNNISVFSWGENKELRAYVDLNNYKGPAGWTHLVLTSEAGEVGTNLYLNGKRIAHDDCYHLTQKPKQGRPAYSIGTFLYKKQPTNYATDPMFQGAINDVRVYKRALNATEVDNLYTAENNMHQKDSNPEENSNAIEMIKCFSQQHGQDKAKQYFGSQLVFFNRNNINDRNILNFPMQQAEIASANDASINAIRMHD